MERRIAWFIALLAAIVLAFMIHTGAFPGNALMDYLLAQPSTITEAKADNCRAIIKRWNPTSPLLPFVKEIVDYGEKYHLDYRLYLGIAMAESTMGHNYPRGSNNLTGICNGRQRFKSIPENIRETYRIIAELPAYAKFRRTGRLIDLVKPFKGVPPYDRYIRTMQIIKEGIER